MKSAYEIALERMKESGAEDKVLTDEQREAIQRQKELERKKGIRDD